MMDRFKVPRTYLMALLNELYYDNKRNLVVRELLGGRELFRITLGERCTVRVASDGWERDPTDIEVPGMGDLLETLRASGVLRPDNWDALVKELRDAAARDLREKPPVYLSFDTNCLRWRLYDTLQAHAKARETDALGLVLSGVVQRELEGFDRKFTPADVEALKRAGVPDRIASDLQNQLKLTDRKIRLGFEEFRQVQRSAEVVDSNEDGDVGILRSLRAFRKERGERSPDLLVLTGDNDLCARLKDRGITPFLVRYGTARPGDRLECSWEDAAHLLYVASVIFARISIKAGGTVDVAGVWRGKGVPDWEAEKVKLTVQGEELCRSMERTLAILGSV